MYNISLKTTTFHFISSHSCFVITGLFLCVKSYHDIKHPSLYFPYPHTNTICHQQKRLA